MSSSLSCGDILAVQERSNSPSLPCISIHLTRYWKTHGDCRLEQWTTIMGDFTGVDDAFDVFKTAGERRRPAALADDITTKRRKVDPMLEAHPTDDPEITLEKNYAVRKEPDEGCIHECAYPTNYSRPRGVFKPPARVWKFDLDPFQRTAIRCLEANESVLVAAHTSAGKTVVAEYAIAMALRDHQRVIYTSPIKALSNQKYRDLSEIFSDVGLMTGDVTLKETASCLVMTTEILRSMLYRGSEVVREMAWVIFDEVHYMRDKERGVVWEETIILLPPQVKLVFLSATIPNAREFAEWVCSVKSQPCHVVYTEMRPVPLQHYIYPAGGDGLYLVVDERGNFREENFQRAICFLSDGTESKPVRKFTPTGGNSDVINMARLVVENHFEPAIIFAFSKKECEGHAISLSKFDLTSEEEKQKVEYIFTSAIAMLSEDDRNLPMIQNVFPMLKRGIGVHHGGLLPIIKEVTEILFQEGLIKVLFSTETFSMGLNMPARTVVFTNVRKFDGTTFRWLGGGEYIQMSGRAGRRGIDTKGICVLMVDQKMEPDVAKSMLKGNMDPLNSTFHIGYNMLLNLMRMEGAKPEEMIKKSFHQFQSNKTYPEVIEKLKELKLKLSEFDIPDESELEAIYRIRQGKSVYSKIVKRFMQKPEHLLGYLSPGRLLHIVDNEGTDWGWGTVVNFMRKNHEKGLSSLNEVTQTRIVVDILLYVKMGKDRPVPVPNLSETDGELMVLPMQSECIEKISQLKLNLPADLRNKESRKRALVTLREVFRRLNNSIPLIHPIVDMRISDEECKEAWERLEALEGEETAALQARSENFQQEWKLYEEKKSVEKGIQMLTSQLDACRNMVLADDFKSMKRVLRRLEFTKAAIVETKGRIACEISTSDEIIATELMLSGVLRDLPPDVTAALLSCLVHEENSNSGTKTLTEPALQEAYGHLRSTATRIATVFRQCKLDIDLDAYVNNYKPTMMEPVLAWARGATFAQLCQMTDCFEGSVIRSIRRLHELLRQLEDACKAVGSVDLARKFQEAAKMIEHGIVFAASLYL